MNPLYHIIYNIFQSYYIRFIIMFLIPEQVTSKLPHADLTILVRGSSVPFFNDKFLIFNGNTD